MARLDVYQVNLVSLASITFKVLNRLPQYKVSCIKYNAHGSSPALRLPAALLFVWANLSEHVYELGIFFYKLFQPSDVRCFHAIILGFPVVLGCTTDIVNFHSRHLH